jgi:hypothetical protein
MKNIALSLLISIVAQICFADSFDHSHGKKLDKKYEITLNKEIDCVDCAEAIVSDLKKKFKCQVQHPQTAAKTNLLYFSSISIDIDEVKSELKNIGYEVVAVKILDEEKSDQIIFSNPAQSVVGSNTN